MIFITILYDLNDSMFKNVIFFYINRLFIIYSDRI